MELRVLNYFLAIAREENITKAAQILHLTQPTLSRQMMQLEEELGVKLFTRSNHKVFLTEEGMLLKRRAQEIITLADKTKRDFMCKEENLSGEIAIGCGEFLSTRIIAQMIRDFHKKYPLVQYQIYSGNADNVRDSIDRGLMDIGVMVEPIDIQKYDFLHIPKKEIWGIWAQKCSPLAHKSYVEAKDLDGVPLITASRKLMQSEIENWFAEENSNMNIVATGNLLYNEALLAERSMGIVLGIKLECTYENLVFIPLKPAIEMNTVMIWKKERSVSKTTSEFILYAKEYLKSITEDLT